MKERWQDIPEWEGLYQASDQGRIRSLDRVVPHSGCGEIRLKGQIIRPGLAGRFGHVMVSLSRAGICRSELVHRLVALTWIGPCPPNQQVRHGLNGVADNSVDNLCYGTPHEDGLDKRRDGTHTGKAVRRSDGREFISMTVAAEESGCWASDICQVCKGRCLTTGGYSWEYV